ncbi:hypothetical protein TrLO_g6106 [Triparma laevis f. longispina]|uniref:Endonuclease I n=1 Tax=Triparma laevis f. longispina TaxID=1714387 RepID=A0A9W7CIV0_9STRA|nr:hypothetical protein TrLO_g6106 [Triparma laevis f. longispina]
MHLRFRFPFLLLPLTLPPTFSTDCSLDNYYLDVSDILSDPTSFTPLEIDSRLKQVISPHTIIPYTSTNTDCWDALNILDADPTNPSNVILIYKQTSEPISTSGLSTGWNREHVWPKSYGVGYTGPDTSDLLSLRAADWSVNSARNNRYYDDCNDPETCTIPAHSEAPLDTGKMSISGTTGIFMPPTSVRGDLARSLFYMATRYDGTDSNTEDLKLSNCVCDTTYTMGKLSTLLEWHLDDPVDDEERERNGKLCEEYQHNRNPYIDFPELVMSVFIDDDEENCPVCPEKESEDDEEEDAEFYVNGPNHFQPGDVAIIGYNSDSTKSVQLLTLVDLPIGSTIFVTDEAWMGEESGFSRNAEGSLKFRTEKDVEAGTVINWIDDDGEFTFGLQYRSSTWDSEVDTGSNSKGLLPDVLKGGDFKVAVSHKDNKRWVEGEGGRWKGYTKEGFLELICDGGNWEGSDSVVFDFAVLAEGGEGKFCVCEEEGQTCKGGEEERRKLFGMLGEDPTPEPTPTHVRKQCY